MPPHLAFQAHTALAWDMVQTLQARQVLPFGWVLGDEAFGKDPAFLDRIAAADLC